MTLKAIILGCGTSSGVPRIGGDWGQCDPDDSRNARTRASIIIESATTRILVDTSPDMRQQLLAAGVAECDAIIWTHDHADHCHGIDDVRQMAQRRRAPLDGYARSQTLSLLTSRFSYAFEGKEGYRPIITAHELPPSMTIGDISVISVDMPHGSIFSSGLRFESDGRSIGYATDYHIITDQMKTLFADLDLWIVDALREEPHPTHPHLAMVLEAIALLHPARAILTHMDASMDYMQLASRLPIGVEPGVDGLVVQL